MGAAGTKRRDFIRNAGLGLLLFHVDGVGRWLTPRQARAEAMPLETLGPAQAATLEALGETLLPGAAEAGITHFVDRHLSIPAEDSLLMLRYLDVPPPYAPFYQIGLANLERLAQRTHGTAFALLDERERHALVARISTENPGGWEGSPAPLFYFTVRADAVDVVYGTVEGFEKLGVPYMAHIEPASPW